MSLETIIVDRLVALYGPPQTDNPGLFLAEWRRCFHGMDSEIVTAAVNKIIRDRTFMCWPTIGEMMKAVESVSGPILLGRRCEEAAAMPRLPAPKKDPASFRRVQVMAEECISALNPARPKSMREVRESWRKQDRESFERFPDSTAGVACDAASGSGMASAGDSSGQTPPMRNGEAV